MSEPLSEGPNPVEAAAQPPQRRVRPLYQRIVREPLRRAQPTPGMPDRIRTRLHPNQGETNPFLADEIRELEIPTVSADSLRGTTRIPRVIEEQQSSQREQPETTATTDSLRDILHADTTHLTRVERIRQELAREERFRRPDLGPDDPAEYARWHERTMATLREDPTAQIFLQDQEPGTSAAAGESTQEPTQRRQTNISVSPEQPGIFNYTSEAGPLPEGRLHGQINQIGLNNHGELVLMFQDGQVSLLRNQFRNYRPGEGRIEGMPFSITQIRTVNGENIVELSARGAIKRERRTLNLDTFLANLNNGRVVLQEGHPLHIGPLQELNVIETNTPASREVPGLIPFNYRALVPGIITDPVTHIGVDSQGELVIQHNTETVWKGNSRGSILGRTLLYRDPNNTDELVRLQVANVTRQNDQAIIQCTDRAGNTISVPATELLNSINNGTDVDRWRIDWNPNNPNVRGRNVLTPLPEPPQPSDVQPAPEASTTRQLPVAERILLETLAGIDRQQEFTRNDLSAIGDILRQFTNDPSFSYVRLLVQKHNPDGTYHLEGRYLNGNLSLISASEANNRGIDVQALSATYPNERFVYLQDAAGTTIRPAAVFDFVRELQPRLTSGTLHDLFAMLQTTAEPEAVGGRDYYAETPPRVFEITQDNINRYIPGQQVPFLSEFGASPIAAPYAYENPSDPPGTNRDRRDASYALGEAATDFDSGLFALANSATQSSERANLFRLYGTSILTIYDTYDRQHSDTPLLNSWLQAQGDPNDETSSLGRFLNNDHANNQRTDRLRDTNNQLFGYESGTYSPEATIALWTTRRDELRALFADPNAIFQPHHIRWIEFLSHAVNIDQLARDIARSRVNNEPPQPEVQPAPAPAPAGDSGDSGPGLGPTEAPTSAAAASEGDPAAEIEHQQSLAERRTEFNNIIPHIDNILYEIGDSAGMMINFGTDFGIIDRNDPDFTLNLQQNDIIPLSPETSQSHSQQLVTTIAETCHITLDNRRRMFAAAGKSADNNWVIHLGSYQNSGQTAGSTSPEPAFGELKFVINDEGAYNSLLNILQENPTIPLLLTLERLAEQAVPNAFRQVLTQAVDQDLSNAIQNALVSRTDITRDPDSLLDPSIQLFAWEVFPT